MSFTLKYEELLDAGVREELGALIIELNEVFFKEHNEDGSHVIEPAAAISDLGMPVGALILFAGSTIPTGWLLCNGQAVDRALYARLFDVIGETYGAGDGLRTFNIPDLRQKFPMGVAASGVGNALGATGGSIDHTHTGPSHTHTVSSTTTAVQAGAGTTVVNAVTTPTGAAGAGNTGGANPPFLAINYLILYT